LERFNLTQEGYRKKLREAEADEDETPAKLFTRIETYVHKWVELSGGMGIAKLMATEQFISLCSDDLAVIKAKFLQQQ